MNANDDRDFTPEELTITPFDGAEYLDSEETISAHLAALLEEGNAKAFAAGLGDVARERAPKPVWLRRTVRAPLAGKAGG